MGMRVVERPQGTGLVTRESGAEIGRRRYSLTVYQEEFEVAGMQQATQKIDGLKEIEGRVELADGEFFKLMDAEDLRLTLEDGRVLPFAFQNPSGRIAVRGELK